MADKPSTPPTRVRGNPADKPRVGGRKRPGGRTAAAKGNGAGEPGQGDGWGGPAKGAGAGPEALIPGQPEEKAALTAENVRGRVERVSALEDKLFTLAMTAEREETQISAAAKLHAIYEGQPVARQISAQVDDIERLNDAELRDELARLSRAGTEAKAGTAAKGVPKKSVSVVH